MLKSNSLPDDFEELLKRGDLDELKAVFDKCAVDAVGGRSRGTALAFADCPDALAVWLVDQGLNIDAIDCCGETALQTRAGLAKGRIESLITLGADVNVSKGKGTPLRSAAGVKHVQNVAILLKYGAKANVLDSNSMTPLEFALSSCSNEAIVSMAQVADLLLAAGAAKTPCMRELLTRVGTHFELHRANYNPDTVQETSDALMHLYEMLDVAPVPSLKSRS